MKLIIKACRFIFWSILFPFVFPFDYPKLYNRWLEAIEEAGKVRDRIR